MVTSLLGVPAFALETLWAWGALSLLTAEDALSSFLPHRLLVVSLPSGPCSGVTCLG